MAWNEDLATGIEKIDEQHKEIFRRVDALLESCRDGKGKEEVGDMLTFLDGYILQHFRDEEDVQRSCSFPGYDEHKKMHEEFILDVQKLKAQFEREGTSNMMAANLSRVLVVWFVQHIWREDRALSDFIRANGYKGSQESR